MSNSDMEYIKTMSVKKLLATYILILSINRADGQITKGNWLMGGGGNFYAYQLHIQQPSLPDVKSNYSQINLSPNIGYFVADKIAFGIRPTFSSIKNKTGSSTPSLSTNTQRYWIGPFGRYYFMQSNSRINIVTDISYQYGFLGGIFSGKLNTFSAQVGPVLYFNKAVGLEFLLGYSSSFEHVDQLQKESKQGFQMGIGFQIHIEK